MEQKKVEHPANLKYDPFPVKSEREEFNYKSFDDFFNSNYQLKITQEKGFDIKNITNIRKRPIYVKKFNLMDFAENYLITLGEFFYKLRNLETDQNEDHKNLNDTEGGAEIHLHPKRFLKKRLVKKNKRRRAIRRESKRFFHISSKLFEIENNLMEDEQLKENNRKLTEDIS